MENRKTGKMATRYSSIYEATGLISHALIGIYLCLSFVQQPPWCRGVPPGPPENNTYYVIEIYKRKILKGLFIRQIAQEPLRKDMSFRFLISLT